MDYRRINASTVSPSVLIPSSEFGQETNFVARCDPRDGFSQLPVSDCQFDSKYDDDDDDEAFMGALV